MLRILVLLQPFTFFTLLLYLLVFKILIKKALFKHILVLFLDAFFHIAFFFWLNFLFFLSNCRNSIFPQITINVITIALIILGFLPWLPLLIKEIALPSGTKITLRDVKEPSDNIIEEGKCENIEPKIDENESKRQKQLEYIAIENPNIALVSVRIEIEKRICELAQLHLKTERSFSLKRAVYELVKK